MNLWTEYIPQDRVDTMLFPRLTAMAEALWTGTENRHFVDFLERLENHQPVLDHLGVQPGAAARPLEISSRFEAVRGTHQLEISLDDRIADALADRDLNTRYLILESPWPASFSPEKSPEDQGLPAVTEADDIVPKYLEIPASGRRGTSWLVMASLFSRGRTYGAPALLEISGHEALGAEISFGQPPSPRYPGGGPSGLINGLHGSRFFRDDKWTGFEGQDLEATLDLGEAKDLRRISVRFLQDVNAWIFLPREVRFEISKDGKDWRLVHVATHEVSDKIQDKTIREFSVDLPPGQVRYLRITGVSPGVCPAWHPGRGEPCWIFADEIVCR